MQHDMRHDMQHDMRHGIQQDMQNGMQHDMQHNMQNGMQHDMQNGMQQDLRVENGNIAIISNDSNHTFTSKPLSRGPVVCEASRPAADSEGELPPSSWLIH